MNPRFAIAFAAMALIAGCNTMHGVGEDISAGGRKVEETMKKDKSTGATSPTTTNSSSPATTAPSSPAAGGTTTPSGTTTQ
jgi:predicted small secreted protein